MAILIDGHNLIGKVPGLRLDDPQDEEELLLRLRAYRARTGKHLVVYFDPGVTYQSSARRLKGGISIRQAGAGQRADDLLIRDLRRHHNPRELTVVTSDRAIQRAARQCQAHVMDAATFAAEMSRPAEKAETTKQPPVPEEEVQEWLALFGQADA